MVNFSILSIFLKNREYNVKGANLLIFPLFCGDFQAKNHFGRFCNFSEVFPKHAFFAPNHTITAHYTIFSPLRIRYFVTTQ